MADKYVFADEAGNLDFSTNRGASRYFILATATIDDPIIGNHLLQFRRDLAWDGQLLDRPLHATDDDHGVRLAVLNGLAQWPIRVDATILEKRKAQPSIRPTDARFYQTAWYLHFKYVAPRIVAAGDRMLVTAASLGTKKKAGTFHAAVERVVQQVSPTVAFQVSSWPAASDPCLQIADYCTWAIQRKWEGGDDTYHAILAPRIQSEFEVFQVGQIYYY
jgi:hypothetical protein